MFGDDQNYPATNHQEIITHQLFLGAVSDQEYKFFLEHRLSSPEGFIRTYIQNYAASDESNPNPFYKNKYGNSLLNLLCILNPVNSKNDEDKKINNNFSIFMLEIKRYQQNNMDIMRVDKSRRNVMHYACINGEIDKIKFLLNIHAAEQWSIRDANGMTPLHYAYIAGHYNRRMISQDNLGILDNNGNPAIHYALTSGLYQVFEWVSPKSVLQYTYGNGLTFKDYIEYVIEGHGVNAHNNQVIEEGVDEQKEESEKLIEINSKSLSRNKILEIGYDNTNGTIKAKAPEQYRFLIHIMFNGERSHKAVPISQNRGDWITGINNPKIYSQENQEVWRSFVKRGNSEELQQGESCIVQ